MASSNVGFVKYLHIKQCRTAFLHFQNIFKDGNILSQSGAEKVADGFITSRLDNCCSLLLSSCPKNSLIQTAAVRVLTERESMFL